MPFKRDLEKLFADAVDDYREILITNFNSRHGDSEDPKPAIDKITKIFSESPEEKRSGLKYRAMRVLLEPPGFINDDIADATRRRQICLLDKANELANMLDKIK